MNNVGIINCFRAIEFPADVVQFHTFKSTSTITNIRSILKKHSATQTHTPQRQGRRHTGEIVGML